MGRVTFPAEWCETTLGAVLELQYGESLPEKTRDGGEYPVYGSNGIVGGHSQPLVNKEGIIVGRKGSYGEVQLSEAAFFPIDTTYYVDEFFGQPIKYWFYQLKKLPLTELNRSTAIPGLNREDAYSQIVGLPPLAEQQVIADRLDSLLAQVGRIKARLESIPETLKSFRQSLLAAAVSGKMTEQWRGTNKTNAKTDLSAEVSFRDQKDKKIEPTSEHILVTQFLPREWETSNFDTLYRFIDYRGKTPKKSPTGKRLYTAKNIKMGYLADEPVEFLSDSDYQSWMTRGFTKAGDIFFVTEGHTMGCVALNNIGSDIALAQRTLTLQPFGKVNTKFHYYYMMTDSFQKLVELNATGSAAKGIKAAKFRGLPVPFPSLEEQAEIVRRLEQLFVYANVVEQKAIYALDQVNTLAQSILSKAFRGELTADWRATNFELISENNSAEELLKKIASERQLVKAARKSRVGKEV